MGGMGAAPGVIRTDRLVLRRWRDDDRPHYLAMNQDPVVMEHMQGLQSADVSNDFIDRIEAHWDEHGWGLWALEVPGIAPFIGFTGLWPATHVLGWESREVGWRLARQHCLGLPPAGTALDLPASGGQRFGGHDGRRPEDGQVGTLLALRRAL